MNPVVQHRNFCLACQKGGVQWEVHEDYHRLLDLAAEFEGQTPQDKDLEVDYTELEEETESLKTQMKEAAGDLGSLALDVTNLLTTDLDDLPEAIRTIHSELAQLATELKDRSR